MVISVDYSPIRLIRHIEYPSPDGLPIAENAPQRKPLTCTVAVLDLSVQERADVHVSRGSS